jgi:hypothetical protein
VPLRARGPAPRKRTEDAETLARAGSWVYVVGSQYAAKEGPLEPRRHFVARFDEALVEARGGALRARVEVARRPFLLHRLVNDALARFRVKVLGAGSAVHAEYVEPVRKKGEAKRKRWAELLHAGDAPVNVEGAAFLPGGHLLLGLRYPTTADGHPILVEVEGIDRYFERRAASPEVTAVRVVGNVGSRAAPAGVRELDALGAEIHLVTGNLDGKPDESRILAGIPGAADAPNEHWTIGLALGAAGPKVVRGERVRGFARGATVEGLALVDDEVWYAHDDELIRLEVAGGGASRADRAPTRRPLRSSGRAPAVDRRSASPHG